MAMIDPRTPIGKATLRYRGLPTRHLLSLLRLGVEDPRAPVLQSRRADSYVGGP